VLGIPPAIQAQVKEEIAKTFREGDKAMNKKMQNIGP
jgi:hypothetical protein